MGANWDIFTTFVALGLIAKVLQYWGNQDRAAGSITAIVYVGVGVLLSLIIPTASTTIINATAYSTTSLINSLIVLQFVCDLITHVVIYLFSFKGEPADIDVADMRQVFYANKTSCNDDWL